MRVTSGIRFLIYLASGVAFACLSAAGVAQTTVFSDNFDDGDPGGAVSGADWPAIPGRINGYLIQPLIGSNPEHQKNHTPSTDGQMGDPSIGGSAFEVDNNPYPYASYHEFEFQTGILRLSAWVWEDAERPLCTLSTWPVRGMVGLTSLPGEPVITMINGQVYHEIYPYQDYAFIGVESPTSNNPDDPVQKFYRWRTKTDGWNLTTVPRKADYVCHGAQTWRHVEIVVHPFSGRVGDIQFFIDGVLVGEGKREPGVDCQGVEFRRIQLGTRFPETADGTAYKPPYSYEHFWFDDVALSVEDAALPCANPELRFDADADGDVDQSDFAVIQACFTGADGGPFDCLTCKCMNTGGDTDIDGDDLLAFEQCASAPGVAADVTCDDGLSYP